MNEYMVSPYLSEFPKEEIERFLAKPMGTRIFHLLVSAVSPFIKRARQALRNQKELLKYLQTGNIELLADLAGRKIISTTTENKELLSKLQLEPNLIPEYFSSSQSYNSDNNTSTELLY